MRHTRTDADAGTLRPAQARRALHVFAPWAVFFAYLGVIEIWIGWRALLAPWQTLQPGQIGIAACLFMLSYAVRAHRFHDYLRDATRGRWLSVLRLVVIHNALNNLLPMRSGELSFPLLAKRYFDLPYGRSVPALLWFRLLDLHTVLVIGAAALISRAWGWQPALLLALPCAAIPILALGVRNRLRIWAEARRKGKLKQFTVTLLEGLPGGYSPLLRSWLLTWANWLLKILVLAWVLAQFLDIGGAGAIVGAIGGELTSVLPFHAPAGAGSYEAGIVAGLAPFGAPLKTGLEAAVNAHLFVLAAALASAGAAMLFPAPAPPESR